MSLYYNMTIFLGYLVIFGINNLFIENLNPYLILIISMQILKINIFIFKEKNYQKNDKKNL